MDAYLTDQSTRMSFDLPPVLIAGTNDSARRRGVRTVEASGLRVADSVPLDAAAGRLDRQVSASALWLELEEDHGSGLDELLNRVREDVGNGRYRAVIAGSAALLDQIVAGAGDADIEILIDADEPERLAALAVISSRAGSAPVLSDVAADRNAARLRQLSDEVSRIASTLARLSTGPQPSARPEPQHDVADLPELSADTVRTVIRARRLRSRFFSEELFADPAWDMLLDLLPAEISQLRVPVSRLCIAAAVPATTALRWLKTMTAQGLFVRRADPHDGRRVFVELAPKASQALRRYFAEVGTPAVI
jgi:hypothetical protein